MFKIFTVKDEDLIRIMGLDRFMILKFLRMAIFLFFGFSILAIPILFPINIIDQGNSFGLNRYTMGNVISDNRTWAHCLLAIVLFGKVNFFFIFSLKILRQEIRNMMIN
jgi:hypothetical protein